ncbi:MAG: hypothetical protein EBY52_07955, partial [Actinobacteria bacterium]|nr:hypothetical protein [Actinomycetota bacterium]
MRDVRHVALPRRVARRRATMTVMAISMSPDWLGSYTEQPVDPTRPIVDPHHHLWPPGLPLTYGVDELVADTGSGHNIVKTVFVECGAGYSHRDPDPMAPVGETRFVAEAAAALLDRYPDR